MQCRAAYHQKDDGAVHPRDSSPFLSWCWSRPSRGPKEGLRRPGTRARPGLRTTWSSPRGEKQGFGRGGSGGNDPSFSR
eukprot:CAMPEP_0185157334 /NCGR_PEP_ID=MMETSP1139-20130426/1703_1 /TAXON_ID=298111 /ORGANISM="Pavlova sp., Strain CCMP459" /LENGTH=78 /DNA_ID=CAMNT_0027722411 /DNA_START=234 /DNA_END=466 /DNA_ORIENTATION=+